MTRIVHLDSEPFHELPFVNVGTGRRPVRECIPFYRATANRLPEGLDAILLTADLQGREVTRGHPGWGRLVGEAVVDECGRLARSGALPPLERIGVLLAGDFYARENMDRRGGSGDVLAVWVAFADAFRWVAGVAGNHDVLHPDPAKAGRAVAFIGPQAHFLDADWVEVDGLRIGGLSGVVGDNLRKPFRRREASFAEAAAALAAGEPDILVMHDGPDGDETQLGWASVRKALELGRPTLVVRGHCYWESPLATLRNGTQVLNVDSRVVVVTL